MHAMLAIAFLDWGEKRCEMCGALVQIKLNTWFNVDERKQHTRFIAECTSEDCETRPSGVHATSVHKARLAWDHYILTVRRLIQLNAAPRCPVCKLLMETGVCTYCLSGVDARAIATMGDNDVEYDILGTRPTKLHLYPKNWTQRSKDS